MAKENIYGNLSDYTSRDPKKKLENARNKFSQELLNQGVKPPVPPFPIEKLKKAESKDSQEPNKKNSVSEISPPHVPPSPKELRRHKSENSHQPNKENTESRLILPPVSPFPKELVGKADRYRKLEAIKQDLEKGKKPNPNIEIKQTTDKRERKSV
jgi:hypothetical protein